MGSGTSGLIRDAAGDFVQQECDKIIAVNKGQPIPIGSAVVTKAGSALEKLNIHYIIHAVGMGYVRVLLRHSHQPEQRLGRPKGY